MCKSLIRAFVASLFSLEINLGTEIDHMFLHLFKKNLILYFKSLKYRRLLVTFAVLKSE